MWDRKYQKYFYPVQILRFRRFISIPTYKMRSAGAIFKFWRTMAHQQQRVLYHVLIFCLSYFIPSARRAKGYSKEEAVKRTLQQQVHCEAAPLSSTVAVFFSPPPPLPCLIPCCRPFGLQPLSLPQLSSATASCQPQPSPPLHRCLASLVCWLTPPNHCLLSVAKAVTTSPLVRSCCLFLSAAIELSYG